MRLESGSNRSNTAKWITLISDKNDILLHIDCEKEEDGWQIILENFSSERKFSFMYYGKWNKNKIFDEVLEFIKEYRRAKLTVFSRVFK